MQARIRRLLLRELTHASTILESKPGSQWGDCRRSRSRTRLGIVGGLVRPTGFDWSLSFSGISSRNWAGGRMNWPWEMTLANLNSSVVNIRVSVSLRNVTRRWIHSGVTNCRRVGRSM